MSISAIIKLVTPLATIIAAIITVGVTYYKTKKLKLFDLYFTNKVNSYRDFFNCLSEYFELRTQDSLIKLRSSLYYLALFSTDEIYEFSVHLIDILIGSNDLDNYIKTIIVITQKMRDDLDNCKKYKFR